MLHQGPTGVPLPSPVLTPRADTSCPTAQPQTPHAGHSFRFLCVLGKGDFTLEDDTYSLRYTPVAATHPVCANNYCYLHVPREYVGDGKHKQSSNSRAAACREAAAQRTHCPHSAVPPEPLHGHMNWSDNNSPVWRDWNSELKTTVICSSFTKNCSWTSAEHEHSRWAHGAVCGQKERAAVNEQ